MGENGLLAPHRVGRNQEKVHNGTIITDKVNEGDFARVEELARVRTKFASKS
jgi:hypothetical protein